LLRNGLFSIADWFRRIEYLPDAVWRLRCARRVVILIARAADGRLIVLPIGRGVAVLRINARIAR
jgi:hypothetical protein